MFIKNRLVIVILGIMTMMVCATSTQAQQNYFVPAPKSADFFDHRVLPGESCESITRKYYGVEDARVLLHENPWLTQREIWRNGVFVSYLLHPGEYIRILWGGHPSVVLQPQTQPIKIIENSFVNSPVFWIAVGFFFLMLIALSIIIGILWGGGHRGYYAVQGMHHTHDHNHAGVVEVQYPSSPGGSPLAPTAPAGGGGEARPPVEFKKPDKECRQDKD